MQHHSIPVTAILQHSRQSIMTVFPLQQHHSIYFIASSRYSRYNNNTIFPSIMTPIPLQLHSMYVIAASQCSCYSNIPVFLLKQYYIILDKTDEDISSYKNTIQSPLGKPLSLSHVTIPVSKKLSFRDDKITAVFLFLFYPELFAG